jgi:alanine racemase
MKRRAFIKALGAGPAAAAALTTVGLRAQDVGSKASGKAAAGPAGFRDARIEVNLACIRWNLAQVRDRVKVPVMAVVKANAYGHGLVGTSLALEKAGAHSLMVGKLQEALTLREGGIRCPILNFGPFDRRDSPEIINRGISQAVFTEDAAYLDEAAARLGQSASVHFDIDTGMGRTGAASGRALSLIEKTASLSHLRIDGVCTTLTEDPDFDEEQLRLFLRICSAAEAKGIRLGLKHAASSAAVFYSPEFALDMVRPGITLYGYYPNARTRKEDPLGLKPALKLTANVTFIKDLAAGETFSYLRAFKAERGMRVATVGIGYSDGYPSLFGGKVQVLIREKKFPVLGAVTANHTMVGLGDDRGVEVGDEVTLIDPDRSAGLAADDLGEASGIGDYRILIGLSPSLPRVYGD